MERTSIGFGAGRLIHPCKPALKATPINRLFHVSTASPRWFPFSAQHLRLVRLLFTYSSFARNDSEGGPEGHRHDRSLRDLRGSAYLRYGLRGSDPSYMKFITYFENRRNLSVKIRFGEHGRDARRSNRRASLLVKERITHSGCKANFRKARHR